MSHENVFKKNMIFITGAPRSGTSLVTKILDSHPEHAIVMEDIFINITISGNLNNPKIIMEKASSETVACELEDCGCRRNQNLTPASNSIFLTKSRL
jgi:hypothetical protein